MLKTAAISAPLAATLCLLLGTTAHASNVPGTSLPDVVVEKNLHVVAFQPDGFGRVPASLIRALKDVQRRIAYHNANPPDPTNPAAVNAYNRRGRALNAEQRSILAKIRKYK